MKKIISINLIEALLKEEKDEKRKERNRENKRMNK